MNARRLTCSLAFAFFATTLSACPGGVAPPPSLALYCPDGGLPRISISGRSPSGSFTVNTTAVLEDDGTVLCWHVDPAPATGTVIDGAQAMGASIAPPSPDAGAPSTVPVNVSTNYHGYVIRFTGTFNQAACAGSGSWTATPESTPNGAPSLVGTWR